jgi:eukaryotic-like serine/threonine-protein kinase
MPFAAGKRLGPYEILALIGVGGMGEVYKARDIRLNRTVAIKVLPAHQVGDCHARERFEREARTVSSLEHPHICVLHDIGSQNDIEYLVLEYLEGSPLKGPMPIEKVLELGAQIADALSAAHRAGVTHRDLKPANILITKSGVKLLDFGLAKVTEKEITSEDPTRIAGLTQKGTILGTPAYMAPEQVQGGPADARTDIYALGLLLHEMMTGRNVVKGNTAAEMMASVIRDEPERLSNPELDRLVRKCLLKDPEARWQSAADLLEGLGWVSRDLHRSEPPRKNPLLAWAIGGVLTVALITSGVMAWWWVSGRKALPEPRANLTATPLTAYQGIEGHPSFSPDAGQVVFHWNSEKQDNFDIYVKLVGSSAPPLRLTTNAARDWAPEWSPDGKSIAFIRSPGPTGAVYLIPALGGPERKICDTKGDAISWHPDSKRVALMDRTSGSEPYHIASIDVDTGATKVLTRPPKDHVGDGSPAFSPDGESLAFIRWRIPNTGVVHILSLTTGQERSLHHRSGALRLAWAPDGSSIIANNALFPIDGSSARTLEGATELSIEAGVSRSRPDGIASVAFVNRTRDENIWRQDLRPPRPPRQIIASTRLERWPRWSPDGSRIAFQSGRSGPNRVWLSDHEGGNLMELIKDSARPSDWSPDGRQILLDGGRITGRAGADVFVLDVEGGAPRNLTNSPHDEVRASWSRDGKSIYFRSDRSGHNEIWKIPASGGDATQVTRNGSWEAQESPDGKLLYLAKESSARHRDLDQTRGLPGGLWSMPVAGGPEMPLLDSVSHSYWWVTRPGIFFVDFTGARDDLAPKPVRFYDFASRRITRVATIEKAVQWGHGNFSVTQDGSRMIWAQIDHELADIVIQKWKP